MSNILPFKQKNPPIQDLHIEPIKLPTHKEILGPVYFLRQLATFFTIVIVVSTAIVIGGPAAFFTIALALAFYSLWKMTCTS
jgi:hypothetical protein